MLPGLPVPVVLLSGVSDETVSAAAVAIQWDLPAAVAVSYTVDAATSRLRRIVSDSTGIIDDALSSTEQGCHSCAAREDLATTLAELAERGRWESLLVRLPLGSDPVPIVHAIGPSRLAAATPGYPIRVSAVIAAVNGRTVVDDLLGNELLSDRNAATSDFDERTVGEAQVVQVEYADVVLTVGSPRRSGTGLLDTLRRSDSELVIGCDHIDGHALVALSRDDLAADRWVDPARTDAAGRGSYDPAWTVRLASQRPLHPERLLANLELLGGGATRGRGLFWLPSRPYQKAVWDGIGGRLSIGVLGEWAPATPCTNIVMSGVGPGRSELTGLFADTLMTDQELANGPARWMGRPDGLEPWLGALEDGEVA